MCLGLWLLGPQSALSVWGHFILHNVLDLALRLGRAIFMGLPWKPISLNWRGRTNTFQFRQCKLQMSRGNVPWAAAPLTPLASLGFSSQLKLANSLSFPYWQRRYSLESLERGFGWNPLISSC